MRKSPLLGFLVGIGLSTLAQAESFYVGLQGGADFFALTKQIHSQRISTLTAAPILGASVFTAENRHSGIGGIGGGFLGYSWQFQDFSLGLEAFIYGDGSNVRKSATETMLGGFSLSESDRLRGFFGAALKPAYLVNEKAKLYVKGGWVNGKFSVTGTATNFVSSFFPIGNLTTSSSEWISGGQVGVGVELFMSPCLALTVEYNHIHYKKRTFAFISNPLAPLGPNEAQRTTIAYRPQSNNALFGITYYLTPQDPCGPTVRSDGGYDPI